MSIGDIHANFEWMDESLCKEIDGFVPPLSYGPESKISRKDAEARKKICNTCPVWEQCARYTVKLGISNYGVWAGEMLNTDGHRNQVAIQRIKEKLELLDAAD